VTSKAGERCRDWRASRRRARPHQSPLHSVHLVPVVARLGGLVGASIAGTKALSPARSSSVLVTTTPPLGMSLSDDASITVCIFTLSSAIIMHELHELARRLVSRLFERVVNLLAPLADLDNSTSCSTAIPNIREAAHSTVTPSRGSRFTSPCVVDWSRSWVLATAP
jgi:hypothetical protein